MELERKDQCWFCLDPILSRNTRLSNEDVKMYKDIFDCTKKYLKEEEVIRFSIDWSNSERLLTPFCANCYNSSEIIHRVGQELEKIKEHLKMLVETFTRDVKLRTSKNLKEKCNNIDLVKGESENEEYIYEEVDYIFDEGDEYPIMHSEEEVKLSENTLSNMSNISQSGDENFSSDDVKDPRCIYDEKIKKSSGEETNNISVRGKPKLTSGAASSIQKTANNLNLNSDDVCDSYSTVNESNSNSVSENASTLDTYKPVYLEMKNEAGDFVCDICGGPFKNKNRVLLHRYTHYGEHENPFKCQTCGVGFYSETDFLCHEHYKCSVCDKFFENGRILRKHESKFHITEESCEICDSKFKSKNGLTAHIRAVHQNIRNHQCENCGKSFGNITVLKRHKKSLCDSPRPRRFKCEICGDKYFCQNKKLTAHQKEYHTVYTHGYSGEKWCICETCGKTFSSIRNLKRHSKIHSDVRPFSCETCGKTFSSIRNLKRHSKIHSDGRPFSCDVCGWAFNLQHNLKNHMLIHTGEKRHKCTFCQKCFTRSYQLQTHLRLHTGERPYSCKLCGKTFSNNSALYKHNKRHRQNDK